MSDSTPRLKLGELVQMQEMDAATINEALVQLDAFTDACFKGQFVNTPPTSPQDGDTWLLGAAPTGAWSGYAYKVAYRLDGAWRFYAPFNGLRALVESSGSFIVYKDGTWSTFSPPPSFVAFPATQAPSADPNTLDDYEEGTWTPVDGSGAGLALSVSHASYTKIGRQVTVICRLSYPGTASGAGAALGGLPFAAASGCYAPGAVNTDAGIHFIARAAAGGTGIDLLKTDNTAVTNANLGGRIVGFAITYFT